MGGNPQSCRRTFALLAALPEAFSVLPPIPHFSVSHFSHGVCDYHGFADYADHRALCDREAARVPDWPVCPRRWAEGAPEKGGYAHNGRVADLYRDPVADAALGGPVESVSLGGDGIDLGL